MTDHTSTAGKLDWTILEHYSESALLKSEKVNHGDVITKTEWTPKEQLQELTRRIGVLGAEQISQHVSMKPRSNTVIVSAAAKSGTTWILHICHQIRMKGAEPDFENQTDVVTWLELAEKRYGVDPATMLQPAEPYIFATHLPYPLVPKGGRIIHCFRDQKDVLVSSYHYLNSLLSLKGRVSLNMFVQVWYPQVEMTLKDLLRWWEHRHDDDVLLLFYEDLKEDHDGYVRRIAKFISVDCDEDAFTRIVYTTTHTEMVRNISKFDSRAFAIYMAKKIGDTLADEHVGRVRKGGGRSGDGKQLPPDIQAHIDEVWEKVITNKLGFHTYEEMRENWHKEQN